MPAMESSLSVLLALLLCGCADGQGAKQTNFVVCPQSQFSCEVNSGVFGCINKIFRCDDNNDCKDNSDERNCIKLGESCSIPPEDEGTRYGQPDCLKNPDLCNGGVVQIRCDTGYVIPYSLNDTTILQCPIETWERRKISCMRCGKAVRPPERRPVGTYTSDPRRYPWHVGLYKRDYSKSQLVCGGTLISPNILLTAATCVFKDGKQVEARDYTVVAGRSKHNLVESDEHMQRKEIDKILFSWSFNAEITSYEQNIAIVKTLGGFLLNDYVGIACFYSLQRNAHRDFPNDAIVSVPGWGLKTKSFTSSLGEGHFRLKTLIDCLPMAPSTVHSRFFSYDKFCLVIDRNKNGLQETDSGSGIILNIKDTNYLYGVVSVKIEGHDKFSLVTNITKHEKWIRKVLEEFNHEDENACSGPSFRCGVGYCISKDKLCDQNSDCDDGSDEEEFMCSKIGTTEKKANSCTLPRFPIGSRFKREHCTNENCNLIGGTFVETGEIVKTVCSPGFGVLPENDKGPSSCTRGTFYPPIQPCTKMCQQVHSDTLDLRCVYNGKEVPCNKSVFPTTELTYRCKAEHEPINRPLFKGQTTCGPQGTWEDGLQECTPTCGVRSGRGVVKPLISNGKPAKVGDYPWHVGIYWNNRTTNDNEFVCGGTIIATKIILSAAHCFFNMNEVVKPEIIRVGAGKYYRDLARREANAQIRNVKDMAFGEMYRGHKTNYRKDIALLLLDEELKLNSFVLPACIDWTGSNIPKNGAVGTVVGWGADVKGKLNDQLIEANMPYLDLQTCFNIFDKSGSSFLKFITDDKFCVKYINESGTQMGDSGGGYTMVVNNKHYVYGVVSIKPYAGNSYAAFTNVLKLTDWISFEKEALVTRNRNPLLKRH